MNLWKIITSHIPENIEDIIVPDGGSIDIEKKLKKRTSEEVPPSKTVALGDVIGVRRNFYDHYGIYTDNNSVIHYTSKDSDTSSDNVIQETSFEVFLRGAEKFFILDFPKEYDKPRKQIGYNPSGVTSRPELEIDKLLKAIAYTLYSAEETVARAKRRMGENEYNLVFNNCEHFVIWCKTGISESHQVNEIMGILLNATQKRYPVIKT